MPEKKYYPTTMKHSGKKELERATDLPPTLTSQIMARPILSLSQRRFRRHPKFVHERAQ